MVDLFKSVFDDEMFSNLHYAEENPAVISTVNVYKVDGHVYAEEEVKKYELAGLSGDNLAYDLKHNFFVRLNFRCHTEEFKYFTGGFLSFILRRRDPKRIESLLTSYDWAIVSPDVLEEIAKLDVCRPADQTMVEDPTEFMPIYTVLGTTIYSIPAEIVDRHGYKRTIYVGQRSSITPVIHRKENYYHFEIDDKPDIKKYQLV